MSRSIRQRWTRGAIVRISLGDQSPRYAFAQMLDEPEYAFFDAFGDADVPPSNLVERPVLFRLWVMRAGHSGGRWLKVTSGAVGDELAEPVARFKQDPIKPSVIRLTFNGEEGEPVSVQQCEGLERAAVWEPEHVEDRLRDHLAQRPNKWVQSLKPRTGSA
jgi:hypothetical protein